MNSNPTLALHIKNALLDARAKWMEVIVSDLPPVPSDSKGLINDDVSDDCKDDLPLVVDDLHICVQEKKINDSNKRGGALIMWDKTNELFFGGRREE